MAIENLITIVGNLADDPDLRYTPNGVAVANIRVAVNQRYYNREAGQWDERLDGFFTVNVWREMAEHVADSLSKGTRVVVCGRLRSRSFDDRDGNTRWVTEIEADEVSPSLRWARAKVERRPRDGGGQSQRGGEDRSGGGQAPPPKAPEADDVPF